MGKHGQSSNQTTDKADNSDGSTATTSGMQPPRDTIHRAMLERFLRRLKAQRNIFSKCMEKPTTSLAEETPTKLDVELFVAELRDEMNETIKIEAQYGEILLEEDDDTYDK
ncbi:unnamed protein product [Orchesella dallaii]|uniref:Uncharacterized protein n=1 Tax=Orchesella dallaii TaxID=48710 RepID=A0ABP1Q300_9HEXA